MNVSPVIPPTVLVYACVEHFISDLSELTHIVGYIMWYVIFKYKAIYVFFNVKTTY